MQITHKILDNIKVKEKLDEWRKTSDNWSSQKIDKKIVHLSQKQNVLISRVEHLDVDLQDYFLCQMCLDKHHNFFFEHPKEHIPGLMIIEFARQFGMAVSHMFYEISYDKEFILNEMNSKFYNFASTDKPLFAIGVVQQKKYRKDKLTGMEKKGIFVQGKEIIADITGIWQMINKDLVARISSSHMVTHL